VTLVLAGTARTTVLDRRYYQGLPPTTLRQLVGELGSGPAPWYRNFYEYGMETPFVFTSPAAMTCVPNRGGTGKRLFLVNHFITTSGGSRLAAGEVNARQCVLDRVHRCQASRGRLVNFVAVDYATIGDALAAVGRPQCRTPALALT
jgi:hypothetical protein